jgi:tetratricopeptide (TPR) repeat protein
MLKQRRPVPHWGDSERTGRHRFEAAQFEAAVSPLLRGARERMRLEEYSAPLELLALCNRALDRLNKPPGDPRRLEAWLLRADIQCTRLELDEAEELANRVTALAVNTDTERFNGTALLVLARVYRHRGRLHTALDEFVEAQRALRVTGPKQTLATCLAEHAAAMLELGQLDEAWRAFHEAQEIYEDTGQLIPWAENQLSLGRVAFRQGDPKLARALCRRVRAFARREELNRIEAMALVALSEIQVAEDQFTDAERSLDASIDLLEELGLAQQAVQSRLRKALLWLESGAADKARVEFEQLRNSPDTGIPGSGLSLVHGIGLAVSVDGPTAVFQSYLDQAAGGIKDAEQFAPDVVRCLQLAVTRAEVGGFPDRAAQVRRLSDAISTERANE